ncbi:MAG: phosphoribosylamine--glycine ligase [Alphaproteobacteria bacterium]|nr:phosphoribosylamine--glycine ligase [Alphaproteobacteria bacterium]
MRILVIGSGGREHALCWAISASPLCDALYCAPGNGGIAEVAECVALKAEDIPGIVGWAKDNSIDFVVVGPEQPLVAGLVDALSEEGIEAFGPSAKAAQLEGSKGFTKDLCRDYGIPTAAYGRFTEADSARAFIREQGAPIVVKADGLAAGKGVIMAETEDQALAAIEDIFGGKFGEAGAEVVVEEWLRGEEASFFVLVDGKTALPLATAQDHKRAYDGDEGPNTGGMGAYSPAPVMSEALCAQVMEEIIRPTVAAMTEKGMPFKGVLYAGLMITESGPQLLEYNVRFGDPECQPLMMRLMSDILPAMLASAHGTLKDITLRWHKEAALCVVMAAKGYPGAYEKGSEIRGLETASALEDVEIFHAGTTRDGDQMTATGGRVLGVTALGGDVAAAQKRAYEAVSKIDWPDGFYRSDIGWRAVGKG